MKVNFYFVKQAGKTAVECSACGQLFFDSMSEGHWPRVIESAIPKATRASSTHSHGGIFSTGNWPLATDNCHV
jgi:hypothetical protein